MAKPEMNVVVVSGDGDLFAIGGNHFIHAARRNVHLSIFCVNNLNYGMTGGQKGPTTPLRARTSTSPAGNDEPAFNLPFLAKAAGSVYVARWTTLHVRRIKLAMQEALAKKGFSFIEILSPCPTVYGSMNKLGTALDELKYFRDQAMVMDGADPGIADVELRGRIVVGKFVDIVKPVYEPWKRRVEEAKAPQEKEAVPA
jgi:2-oxoglutarate ferredoxin oxidoreductase subunit beta